MLNAQSVQIWALSDHLKYVTGTRVKDLNFPGKISKTFHTSRREVLSAVRGFKGNPTNGVHGQSPQKLKLYNSLSGSKQPLSTGKTNNSHKKTPQHEHDFLILATEIYLMEKHPETGVACKNYPPDVNPTQFLHFSLFNSISLQPCYNHVFQIFNTSKYHSSHQLFLSNFS